MFRVGAPFLGATVRKMLTFVGATVGGSIGWWLGARIDLFTAFIVSMLGTAAGIYYGIKFYNQYYG
jgi:hypothetical protein